MKDAYDDHLKWPFRGVVTIQIVNQAGDHDHIENTLPYNDQTPEEYVGRVRSGERSRRWGFGKFLAHSDLEYNAATKTQYFKYNQRIIHVVKVELFCTSRPPRQHHAHAQVCAGYTISYVRANWSAWRSKVVSRASRIFPSAVRMRVNTFCVGGEGKIRLVTVARFSCRGGM